MKYSFDGEADTELLASPYSLLVYEQEFHSDMIADLYGKVDLRRGADGTSWIGAGIVSAALERANGGEIPDDVRELVAKAFPAAVQTTIDYTATNWGAVLRCAWALAKTAAEAAGTPLLTGFKAWAAALGPVNMDDLSDAVIRETQRGLFRARA